MSSSGSKGAQVVLGAERRMYTLVVWGEPVYASPNCWIQVRPSGSDHRARWRWLFGTQNTVAGSKANSPVSRKVPQVMPRPWTTLPLSSP